MIHEGNASASYIIRLASTQVKFLECVAILFPIQLVLNPLPQGCFVSRMFGN